MIIDFLTVNLKNALNDEIGRAQSAETALKIESFASADYDSSATTINFYNGFGDKIGEIDATDFVVDGMIENVTLSGTILTITFNTAAGKEDIVIDLSEFINPDNYYTKTQVDGIISGFSGDVQTALSGLSQDINSLEEDVFDALSAVTEEISTLSGNTDTAISTLSGNVETAISGLSEDVETQINTLSGNVETAIADFVTSAQVETQITGKNYVTSGDVESQIVNKGYATSGDVNTLSGNIDTRISEVERVTSSGYNELHTDIVALSGQAENFITSGDIQNFVTSAQVETQITGKNYVTSADVETQITNKGYATTGDIQNFVTSADVETQITGKNYVTSGDVQTQITSAMTDSVYSTTIHNIVSISQADYDLLPVKDPNTLYVIINNS